MVLAVALSLLAGKQLSLISKNMTTIEESERAYAQKHTKKTVLFPFSHPSRTRNLADFLGRPAWLWPFCLPAALQMGQRDGTIFYVRKDAPYGGRWPLFDHRSEHRMLDGDSDNEYSIRDKD